MINDSQEDSLDEVPGLAGWMYTDLLLGLMVIFLATITFVPNTIAELPPVTVIEKEVEPFPKVISSGAKEENRVSFIAEFSEFSSEQFALRIRDFRISQGISPRSKVLEAQLIGSHVIDTESPGDGISRALGFGLELEKAFPTLLAGVDVEVETFSSNQSKVLLRLTFERK